MKRWDRFVRDRKLTPEEGGGIIYSNNLYHVIVHLYKNPEEGKSDIIHLSIRSNDRSSRHDWRDFQRIKNEFFGDEHEAIEIYPAESELVDGANQYHLWAYMEQPFFLKDAHFGFHEGRLIWNGKGSPPVSLVGTGFDNFIKKAKQRELKPSGLEQFKLDEISSYVMRSIKAINAIVEAKVPMSATDAIDHLNHILKLTKMTVTGRIENVNEPELQYYPVPKRVTLQKLRSETDTLIENYNRDIQQANVNMIRDEVKRVVDESSGTVTTLHDSIIDWSKIRPVDSQISGGENEKEESAISDEQSGEERKS
jgi:hypothetical protein